MRVSTLLVGALVGFTLVVGACTDDDPEGDNIADLVFDDGTFEQRKAFMQEVFMPAMRDKFQAFDATEYADFSCATCHGATAEAGTFEMPNVDHMLSFSAFPSADSTDEREARFAKFMFEEVTPTAVELLKRQPFDQSTGMGFGCTGCHPAGP